ncbi:hypothetical protein PDJAM_G00024070 [Pangasius djambal]|uniref:Uncharacterized protein n=1 Tax=Pangasius djambal TaxID=1691987 RepID=A0ACC5YNR7_9TELE|nr:hypothetical protein [Pangasius djambal]
MSGQTFEESIKSTMERGMNMKDEEKLYKRNGILYSTIMSPPENLDALKDLEAREDDVLLVAYPKCGCNWMLGVLRKIMTICGYTLPDSHSLLEFYSPDTQKITEYRLLTLTGFSYAVGMGSYFDHALGWEKHMDDPNVLIVTFEELKENLHEGVKKITDFFSFNLTDEQIKAITGESTFSAMQSSSKTSHGNFASIIFRKGEVGDWKNHFSEAQSKQMDEEFKKKLSGTKLGAKLKYEQYCQ